MGNLTQAKEIIGLPNSTLVKTALNATGAAPIYACRAWVNFNGTGTVAIRASGNVSSITDNGVGNYTVNFTTAMPDANFATNSSCENSTENQAVIYSYPLSTLTSRITAQVQDGTTEASHDPINVQFTVLR